MTGHRPEDEAARIRAELDVREFQRDVEAEEEQLHRNTRSMADLLLDWSDAGHRVRIQVGPYAWTGEILGVRADATPDGVATLMEGDRRVDVALAAITIVDQAGTMSTTVPGRTVWVPSTLIARLRQCCSADPRPSLEFGGRHLAIVAGRLLAVSATHVELEHASDLRLVAVPLNAIDFVTSAVGGTAGAERELQPTRR